MLRWLFGARADVTFLLHVILGSGLPRRTSHPRVADSPSCTTTRPLGGTGRTTGSTGEKNEKRSLLGHKFGHHGSKLYLHSRFFFTSCLLYYTNFCFFPFLHTKRMKKGAFSTSILKGRGDADNGFIRAPINLDPCQFSVVRKDYFLVGKLTGKI